MKTFIRTIIVLVVLNLAMGGFATAQNAPGEGDLEAAKEEMEAAKEEMKKAGQKIKEAGQQKKAAMQHDMAQRREEAAQRGRESLLRSYATRIRTPRTGRSRSLTRRHGSSGQVFVIPAAEIKTKDLVTIMEDMSVMSRILDKKLDLSPGGIFPGGMGGFGGMDRFGNLSFFGSTGGCSTEAIFLQGYGALFLIKVDFPLSPPAEEEGEEEPEEDMDALWEETKREIYEPADARRRRADEEEQEEYDAERVEEMKETLIKALKHGANIRNLKASESIIITVTGKEDQAGISVGSSKVILNRDQILIEDEDSKVVRIYDGPFSDEMGFSSPAVMTIRAKKSDVDAFSKGKLDFDEFRKRVQIFTY